MPRFWAQYTAVAYSCESITLVIDSQGHIKKNILYSSIAMGEWLQRYSSGVYSEI
jgi:uncharacterized membrane protein